MFEVLDQMKKKTSNPTVASGFNPMFNGNGNVLTIENAPSREYLKMKKLTVYDAVHFYAKSIEYQKRYN